MDDAGDAEFYIFIEAVFLLQHIQAEPRGQRFGFGTCLSHALHGTVHGHHKLSAQEQVSGQDLLRSAAAWMTMVGSNRKTRTR